MGNSHRYIEGEMINYSVFILGLFKSAVILCQASNSFGLSLLQFTDTFQRHGYRLISSVSN